MEFSYSSIQCFKDCRKKYYYRYILGIKPKLPNINLLIGSAVHLALEAYYNHSYDRFPEPTFPPKFTKIIEPWGLSVPNQSIIKTIYDFFKPYGSSNELKEGKFISMGLVAGYTKVYSPDEFKYIVTEEEFRVPIGEDEFIGKVDGRLEKHILETKTLKTWDITKYIERLFYDAQPTGYLWALKKDNIIGMLYNLIRKPALKRKKKETHHQFCLRLANEPINKLNEYYFREYIYRSESQLTIFEVELIEVIKVMKECEFYYKNTSGCVYCDYNKLCRESYENEETKEKYYTKD